MSSTGSLLVSAEVFGWGRQDTVTDAPSGIVVDISEMPVKGVRDAKLALIEFSDYECPYCQRHAATVFDELTERFVATGEVLYAFANHPLESHPNAVLLATAAICAGEQNLYWEMHDRIFTTRATTPFGILVLAEELVEEMALDSVAFQGCLERPEPPLEIARDVKIAQDLGLVGTPGFALGRMNPDGTVVVEKLILGAQSLTVFDSAISEML